ncbi:MAG: hypothetical protein JRJ46_08645 [Deltaproteobacteria bacterium]|nr:hypothetical protein [Deltaproteobacteria bacterium]
MILAKLKPAVPKYWLIALAGLMWSIVGVMLCRLAYIWLSAIPLQRAIPMGMLGIIFSLAVYRYKFSKIALKNIDRLCLTLRHSSIPKHYLAVLYTAMGGAMFLASFHFFQRIWAVKVLKQTCLPPEK